MSYDNFEFWNDGKYEEANVKNNFSKSMRGTYKAPMVIESKPKEYREFLDIPQKKTEQKGGEYSVNVATDIGVIAKSISQVIDSLGQIIVSCNQVAMQREVTKQIEIQAKAYMMKEKEETKRFRIGEKQQTKRLMATLASEYKKAQLDLIGTVKRLEKEERESKREFEHKREMVNFYIKTIEKISEELDRTNKILFEQLENGVSVNPEYLSQVRELQTRELEMMRCLAQLK